MWLPSAPAWRRPTSSLILGDPPPTRVPWGAGSKAAKCCQRKTVCIPAEWMETLWGWEADPWKIDVHSPPPHREEQLPCPSPSSLHPEKCSMAVWGGIEGVCLVWFSGGKSLRWSISIQKGRERHFEKVRWTHTAVPWIYHWASCPHPLEE